MRPKVKSYLSSIRKKIKIPERTGTFLACVLIATLLWIYQNLGQIRTYPIDYPIEFVFDKTNYVSLKSLPKTIKLEVKGSGWQILRKIWGIQTQKIKYNLVFPIPTYLLNENLRKQASLVVKDVELLDVLTDSLRLDIDKKVKQIIEIKVDSSALDIKKGYEIASPIQIKPKIIAFEGAEKLMKFLSSPYYIKINKKNISESIYENVELKIPQDTNNSIKKDENFIKINILIKKKN
ncbi:MAG: hypothetical protein EAZ85_10855 [Bacteroidetes bacterium]|nr:MAG: hypothetical protein EAZ85_10855 [Bacteroidota bacterium]TAG87762.1 MAG: hypothetical protein EAZ20_09985 [Bacteroidota bacterium]